MAASSKHTGWYNDRDNSRLEYYYEGTKVGHMTGTTFVLAASIGVTVTDTGLTVTAGGVTVTAGGLTVTAGGSVVTAGDHALTAGNYRAGAIETFGTTEPTSALVLKTGTAPVGAITTSSGIFATTTVMNKIIADGTASAIGA